MGLFDFLRLKTQSNNNEVIENYLDLEREYLISNPKDNIYGFQKKFIWNKLYRIIVILNDLIWHNIKMRGRFLYE